VSAPDAAFPTAHRPWPLPAAPWVMGQAWHDLLFAHYRADPAALRARVPAELELETFDGSAWLGVVPFRMSGVRVRGLPGVPGASAFPELNVRTYVRVADRPGVWFFSLDATSALAVRAARAAFHLPYFRAAMRCEARGDDVAYDSSRTHRGAPPAVWRGAYGPSGAVRRAERGTLEHWLTERYCLYARSPRGVLRRAEIHHAPWPLQPAFARIEADTMAASHAIDVPAQRPHLLFARRLDVHVWLPRRL
jgi:uncharacterized protein YqjF (DUF2071 family)